MRKFELEKLLDHITENVYDAGHGLLLERQWVIDAEPMLDLIRDLLGVSTPEMTKLFDEARKRVHGEKANES